MGKEAKNYILYKYLINSRKEKHKMTQYIRKIDSLGRIVIPVDYRKKAGLYDFDEAKITEENGRIIIERAAPVCKICGGSEELDGEFGLCAECVRKIKKL